MTYQDRFKERFIDRFITSSVENVPLKQADYNDILAFIEGTVQLERQEAVEDYRTELAAHVEGMRKELHPYAPTGSVAKEDNRHKRFYNRALDDLLAHLRQSDAPQGCCEKCCRPSHWSGIDDSEHDSTFCDCPCHKKAPQGDNKQDGTDKCYLEYDDAPGILVCSYNHKEGEECLMHEKFNQL
jgi:hypothetical protein